jgi:hypothetical protein
MLIRFVDVPAVSGPGARLATVMLLAALFHVPRGEFAALPMNFALGAVAVFIAWGRHRKAPIAPLVEGSSG